MSDASDFFRFSHIPQLAMDEGAPRGDEIRSVAAAYAQLADEVPVGEKLNGANFGISVDPAGTLSKRAQYLAPPPFSQEA